MNWLKVGAVVVGGIVVFFVLDSVVHLLLGLLSAIAFVAIVAGGGYVVYRLVSGRRRREVRSGRREREVRRERDERTIVVPPATPQPQPRHHDVEDDLARLKREMGR
ncbi:MAG TPA: hypothetical protein VKV38_12585 [Trebonia sp.]|jgi:hypothetical protein|nr:hypothetical protein [Trebonia sp.]